jgi:hypothetical protein
MEFIMKRKTNLDKLIRVTALLISISILSCSDYLSDPSVTEDPNRATQVTPGDLLVAIQVNQFFRYEGDIARCTDVWMQQLAGVDRQYLAVGEYVFTETEWTVEFNNAYTGGGLVDIKKLITTGEADGSKIYAGIGKIWEAFDIGYTASMWGAIPYSEAASDITAPKLDNQSDVYTAVQTLLDDAIADLTAGGGMSPGGRDFVYGGDAAKWIQLAHSLKARYYMHWAEVDPSNYQKALTEAQLGISSNAGDFHSVHGTNERESNGVYQFWRDRDSYIRAGKYIIDLLTTNNDPRLEVYFAPDNNGNFTGADPGEANTDASNLSAFWLEKDRPTDILTFTETSLIQAECSYKTGDEASALAELNIARRAQEQKYGLTENSLGIAEGLTGQALIEAIMTEKYISGFMNPESYNDWKRTNLPAVIPYNGKSIPRRLYYSSDERNANPNIPPPSQQPLRNENDPGDNY